MSIQGPANRRGPSLRGILSALRTTMGRRLSRNQMAAASRLSREQLLATLLDNWMTYVGQQRLAPGFGLVDRIPDEEHLRQAIPDFDPPPEISSIDSSRKILYPYDFDESSTEANMERDRVSRWGIAIASSDELAVRFERMKLKPLFTTVGLVSTREGVMLSVIDYYRPNALLRLPRRPGISIGGARFPSFARPWIPEPHVGPGPQAWQIEDGHCWIRVDSAPGILTANHVILPKNATVGATVTIRSKRSPIEGELHQTSGTLDAAVVKVATGSDHAAVPNPFSRRVGFKPVRFITGNPDISDPLEAEVIEWMGFSANGIFCIRSREQEFVARASVFLSRHLDKGDSGCLIIDTEFEAYGRTFPYLIYQGRHNLGYGRTAGRGLLIAQAANEWSLSTYGAVPSAPGQQAP